MSDALFADLQLSQPNFLAVRQAQSYDIHVSGVNENSECVLSDELTRIFTRGDGVGVDRNCEERAVELKIIAIDLSLPESDCRTLSDLIVEPLLAELEDTNSLAPSLIVLYSSRMMRMGEPLYDLPAGEVIGAVGSKPGCYWLECGEAILPRKENLLAKWSAVFVADGVRSETYWPVHIEDICLAAALLLNCIHNPTELNSFFSLLPDRSIELEDVAIYVKTQLGDQAATETTGLRGQVKARDRERLGVTMAKYFNRPLTSPLTVVERVLSCHVLDVIQAERNSCSDRSPPFRLGFVERVKHSGARAYVYEQLFFNPSAYYLTKDLALQHGLELCHVNQSLTEAAHAYAEYGPSVVGDIKSSLGLYFRWLYRIVDKIFERLILAVKSNADDGNSIVFVSLNWNAKLLNEAGVLKGRRKRCFMIVLNGGSSDETVRQRFYSVFDSVMELSHACLPLIAILIRRLRPAVFHVCGNMFFNYLVYLVLVNAGRARTVIDYDDYLLLNGRYGFFKSLVSDAVEALDFETSHLSLSMGSKFLFSLPPYAVGWLEERHAGIRDKYVTFLNWPVKLPRVVRRALSGSRPRLVWAGNVWRNCEATRRFFFSSGLLESIKKLLAAGCEIDIVLDPHKQINMDDEGWAPYHELAQAVPAFRFRIGVDEGRMSDLLAEYDFGLLHPEWNPIFDYAYPQKFEYSVPNKLLTYLAGGIPVLVSRAFAYQSWIVESMGLGIVEEKVVQPDIGSRLLEFDFKGFSDRLSRFIINNSMERNLSRVLPEYI